MNRFRIEHFQILYLNWQCTQYYMNKAHFQNHSWIISQDCPFNKKKMSPMLLKGSSVKISEWQEKKWQGKAFFFLLCPNGPLTIILPWTPGAEEERGGWCQPDRWVWLVVPHFKGTVAWDCPPLLVPLEVYLPTQRWFQI